MLALQPCGELDPRDVHLPIGRRKDHRAARFDPRRVPVAPALPAGRRHPDPEALWRSVARQTALHRRDHPNLRILRQGLRHRRGLPPSWHRESDHTRVGEALSRIDSRRTCARGPIPTLRSQALGESTHQINGYQINGSWCAPDASKRLEHTTRRNPDTMNEAIVAWLTLLPKGLDALVGLLLAFILGATVGIERGISTSSVGIRTCTLVALASAAFANLVIEKVPEAGWGQGFGAVATGVGFLGAGAIIKGSGRLSVTGLGEAGTIWCVAMIGLLIGAREFVTGFFVTLLVLTVNFMLRPVATWIDHHRAARQPEDDVLDG
jgi:putative Mg2+ transporter-C (MgtC) family protein